MLFLGFCVLVDVEGTIGQSRCTTEVKALCFPRIDDTGVRTGYRRSNAICMRDKACRQTAFAFSTIIACIAIISKAHNRCITINSIVLRLCIIDSRTHIVQVGNVLFIPIVTYIFKTALLIVRCIGRGVEIGIAAFHIIECNVTVRLAIFFTNAKDYAPCVVASFILIVDVDGGAIDAHMVALVITIRRIGVYIEAAAVAVGRITKDDLLIKADGYIGTFM